MIVETEPEVQGEAGSSAVITREEVCECLVRDRSLLMGVILKVENDVQLAEEILSTVAISALSQVGAPLHAASVRAYVKSIAHNEACSHVSRTTRRKNKLGIRYHHEDSYSAEDSDFSDDEIAALTASDGMTPEREVEHRELLQRVLSTLDTIEKRRPRAAQTWKLYYLEDKDYEEIVELTGVSYGEARLHVLRVGEDIRRMTGFDYRSLFNQ